MKQAAIKGRRSLASKVLGLSLCLALSFWFIFKLLKALGPMLPAPLGERSELLYEGLLITLELTLGAAILGLSSGLFWAFCLRAPWPLRAPTSFIVAILKGTPLLVQILFCYFALPVLLPWLGLSDFESAILALGLNMGAYNCEVIAAGLDAVARGQWEASWSLGLSRLQTMRFVILPQTFRLVLPPLLNNLIALLKDSSLASTIGLLELSMAAQRISSETFEPVSVLSAVAVLYLILTLNLTFFIRLFDLESRKQAFRR